LFIDVFCVNLKLNNYAVQPFVKLKKYIGKKKYVK